MSQPLVLQELLCRFLNQHRLSHQRIINPKCFQFAWRLQQVFGDQWLVFIANDFVHIKHRHSFLPVAMW